MGAVICYWNLRSDEGIVDLFAVVVDQGDTSKLAVVFWIWSISDHFAVKSDVFACDSSLGHTFIESVVLVLC